MVEFAVFLAAQAKALWREGDEFVVRSGVLHVGE